MQAMQVKKLDHVNIHTANVDRLVEWYDRVLGMQAGDRPPFPFPGAWLHCGGQPPIPLGGVPKQTPVSTASQRSSSACRSSPTCPA